MSSEIDGCSVLARQVYSTVLKMASGNTIRTTTVMDGLGNRLGFGQIEVKEALRELYRARLLQYHADNQDLPISGLITVIRPIKEPSAHERLWTQALNESSMSEGAKDALQALRTKLPDLSVKDMRVLAESLAKLEAISATGCEDAGFNVSARQIMGGSKVLANLAPKMLQALGLSPRLQIPSPRYVICAGPPHPAATLLIENPRAFENAVRSGLCKTVALVCTYGFGLSYLGQAWDSEALENDRPVQIVRAGVPPPIASLLKAENVFLWADLDVAALNIFRSLKTAIPQLRFSRIYESMMRMALEDEKSHPYATIFEKDGQTPIAEATFQSSDRVVQAIAESCRLRAVDQESVVEAEILLHGRAAYEPLD